VGSSPRCHGERLRIQRSEVEWSIGSLHHYTATPLHHYTTSPHITTPTRSWHACGFAAGWSTVRAGSRQASIEHRDVEVEVEVEQRPTIYVLYTWLIIAAGGGGAPFLPFLVSSFGSAWKVSAFSAEDRCPEMPWSLKRCVCSIANKIGYSSPVL
jgi:hypothetical protein